MGFLDFYKISGPSVRKVDSDRVDETWRKKRFQAFLAGTFASIMYAAFRWA